MQQTWSAAAAAKGGVTGLSTGVTGDLSVHVVVRK